MNEDLKMMTDSEWTQVVVVHILMLSKGNTNVILPMGKIFLFVYFIYDDGVHRLHRVLFYSYAMSSGIARFYFIFLFTFHSYDASSASDYLSTSTCWIEIGIKAHDNVSINNRSSCDRTLNEITM